MTIGLENKQRLTHQHVIEQTSLPPGVY